MFVPGMAQLTASMATGTVMTPALMVALCGLLLASSNDHTPAATVPVPRGVLDESNPLMVQFVQFQESLRPYPVGLVLAPVVTVILVPVKFRPEPDKISRVELVIVVFRGDIL